MEFKMTKYSSKYKEELPPINKPTRPASQVIKSIIIIDSKNNIFSNQKYSFSALWRVERTSRLFIK